MEIRTSGVVESENVGKKTRQGQLFVGCLKILEAMEWEGTLPFSLLGFTEVLISLPPPTQCVCCCCSSLLLKYNLCYHLSGSHIYDGRSGVGLPKL